MVVQAKGSGFGRAALRVAKKVAFDDLGAHRFWLDVKARNSRAKALYDSEGFVVEGELRDAVKVADGFDSLIVMSMLRPEFTGRREPGAGAARMTPRRRFAVLAGRRCCWRWRWCRRRMPRSGATSTTRASRTSPPRSWTSATSCSSAAAKASTPRAGCGTPRAVNVPTAPRQAASRSSRSRRATSRSSTTCARPRRAQRIDYELLQALIATESGFDAGAVSPKGAVGLMQVMPATARALRRDGRPQDDRREEAGRPPHQHQDRHRATCATCSTCSRAGWNWRWPPTTPARAPCSAPATRCRTTARPRIT